MTHQFENHEYTRHQPSASLLSNDRKEKDTKISVMKDILSSQTVVPLTIEYITAKIQICSSKDFTQFDYQSIVLL